ncbi:MAG: nuclear transport factor 2 family protein [Armatimonadota bacterium]|nr:nuclear transport factor 2 family protein [Armatimonadota bacterium]MCX7777561.1 nuclear transport factor 2 family protein [Armatimonadota bacterium]MDW8025570.1 nuclear transport factor 2 family protein [Armatimonadota bacterium]
MKMRAQKPLSEVANSKIARYVIGVVVVCIMVVMFIHSQRRATKKHTQVPEDVVLEMFDAMGRGDVNGYLSLLADGARRHAELMLNESGEEEFSRQLRSMHEGIKGIAVSRLEQLSENEVVLRVELVFESKNEVQRIRVRRINGNWRVIEVMQAEHLRPPIPYGTPVDRL